MKPLDRECQQFITQALAVYVPSQEISKAVGVHFAVNLSEEELRLYDPTQDISPERVSPHYIRLFAATRAYYRAGLNFWADECLAGYGSKGHRLALLQHTYDSLGAGDDITQLSPQRIWVALNLLEEAAKVSNDWYEQGDDVSKGDARMVMLITLSKDVDELLKDYEGS